MIQKKLVSNCCGAEYQQIVSSYDFRGIGTCHYECLKCYKVCDLVEPKQKCTHPLKARHPKGFCNNCLKKLSKHKQIKRIENLMSKAYKMIVGKDFKPIKEQLTSKLLVRE